MRRLASDFLSFRYGCHLGIEKPKVALFSSFVKDFSESGENDEGERFCSSWTSAIRAIASCVRTQDPEVLCSH
jgi:hypothetical protein